MATFSSDSFPAHHLRLPFKRADVELHGVDQAVPSYEGRLFLNNPEATEDTELVHEQGYLGSFFVFGKLECWGEEGHCDEPERRKYDRRRNPTRFSKVRLTAPLEVVRRASSEAELLTLSIVVVLTQVDDYRESSPGDVLRFARLSIITYA